MRRGVATVSKLDKAAVNGPERKCSGPFFLPRQIVSGCPGALATAQLGGGVFGLFAEGENAGHMLF